MNSQKSNEWLYLGIACLAAIIVMLPIAVWGIPSGNDLQQHFQFAETVYHSLTTGDGFPNWSDKENFGYGGIGIRFYPPLAYYILAFARILTGNWFDAAWLGFTFWMILGCAGIYFWARCWCSEKESAIAAVFYAVIPYHLSQLYIAFTYADFAGAAVLPFCFAFLTKVMRRGKTSDILGLATFYAVLILTHIPLTVIGSLCLGVYTLILLQKEKVFSQIIKASAGIGIGLAASSFYWFRMVSEMSLLSHATDRFSTGHYSYTNGFFPLYYHALDNNFKYGLLVTDAAYILSLVFLCSAIVYVFYRRTKAAENDQTTKVFRMVLPLGLFGFFMATPLSQPLWSVLPFLQKIQFPFRWMSIVAMCGAIVAAASVHCLIKGNLIKQRVWAYFSVGFVIVLLLFNCVYILHSSAFMPIARADFENQMRELPEKESCTCWWSVWAKPKALNIREKVLAENRETSITTWKDEERVFSVSGGNATTARIATFYYPRWQATVNEIPVNIKMDEDGVILIPLPAEASTVKIFFQEPPGTRIASIFSIVAWLSIIIASLFLWREKFSRVETPETYFAEEEFSC